jgi:hypothetical protein
MEKDMNKMVTRRKSCRLCNAITLNLVLPINASPIADAFVGKDKKNQEQPLIPLDLYQCGSCGHVQNIDIVNPELLFRDYIFSTSNSAWLVEHFRQFSLTAINDFNLISESLVVEIGSNDGTLLKYFKNAGMNVVGIDPAREIAKQATQDGIPTIPEFFDSSLAADIKRKNGAAKLIVANNVYAHVDQLADLTDGIELLLDDDGVFMFEVSYLIDIIDKFVFDTVYHEHLSYHSVKPFVEFFSAHGLHLFDVQLISTKGGSMRGFVQKKGGAQEERPIITKMVQDEINRGLYLPKLFKEYEGRIQRRKDALLEYIATASNNGLKVFGYGASTTVTTLMYHFDLTDKLDCLIDDNPIKHGLYSPGCHLEVKPSTVLYGDDKPEVVVILAWQYAKPIIDKHTAFIEAGGTFVVPLPELNIVSK